MHEWETSYTDGIAHEEELDDYFSKWYEIAKADRDGQRHGIDRTFTSRESGDATTVEYKADSRAAETGNAFIETVSVDTTDAPGWAYTSESDVLVYFVPPSRTAYMVPMPDIRERVDEWKQQYREVDVPNRGRRGDEYKTWGLLVPLSVLRAICLCVRKIPEAI